MNVGRRVRVLGKRVRAVEALNRPFVGIAVWSARGQRRAAGWLERHSKPVGEVPTPLPNGRVLRLIGDGDEPLSAMLRWRGLLAYEPDVVPVWMYLASRAESVLDIGANVGLLSLLAALSSDGATVWAFEPSPTTLVALRRNVEANPDADIRVVPAAAGAAGGEVLLHCDPWFGTDGLATTVDEHPSGRVAPATVVVPCVAVDEWAAENDVARVDLVKIDVEGAEPAVLAGMAGILERDRPDVLIEVLTDQVAAVVADTARRIGYGHFLLTASGPIRTDDIERHPSCANHLLTRRTTEELRRLRH